MEVHHHSHEHSKKSWKAYFWEFLMLFLAVFCGFLAEYQLEHLIEKQKGRQYVTSFLQDLEIDEGQLDQLIPVFIKKDKQLDTMLTRIRGINSSTGDNGIYKYYRQPFSYPDFIYSDRTIQQLKNSGGMRLINNQAVSDSITSYDAAVRLSGITITEGVKELRLAVINLSYKIFDLTCCPEIGTTALPNEINFPEPGSLLTYDSKTLTEYYNLVQECKRQFAFYRMRLEELKRKNSLVKDFLKKEYHF